MPDEMPTTDPLRCDVCNTPMEERPDHWRCPNCGNCLGKPATDEEITACKKAMIFERDRVKAESVMVNVGFMLSLIARIEQLKSLLADWREESESMQGRRDTDLDNAIESGGDDVNW